LSDQDAKSICVRILNDTVNDLGSRYGVESVAAALAEIVGCELCVSEAARGANLHASVEKLSPPEGQSD
jgi:hypothetical protein